MILSEFFFFMYYFLFLNYLVYIKKSIFIDIVLLKGKTNLFLYF